MPYSCESFELTPNYRDKLDSVQTLACSDQALVLRMDKIAQEKGIVWDPKIQKRINRSGELLLKHKKEEHDHDIRRALDNVGNVEQDIKQIRNLGGEPTGKLMKSLKEKENKLPALRKLTDKDLLGVD